MVKQNCRLKIRIRLVLYHVTIMCYNTIHFPYKLYCYTIYILYKLICQLECAHFTRLVVLCKWNVVYIILFTYNSHMCFINIFNSFTFMLNDIWSFSSRSLHYLAHLNVPFYICSPPHLFSLCLYEVPPGDFVIFKCIGHCSVVLLVYQCMCLVIAMALLQTHHMFQVERCANCYKEYTVFFFKFVSGYRQLYVCAYSVWQIFIIIVIDDWTTCLII